MSVGTYFCARGLRYRLSGGLLCDRALVLEAYLWGILPCGV